MARRVTFPYLSIQTRKGGDKYDKNVEVPVNNVRASKRRIHGSDSGCGVRCPAQLLEGDRSEHLRRQMGM